MPSPVIRLLLVGVGGAGGAILRYGVAVGIGALGWQSPLATGLVNVVGCFAMGALVQVVPERLSAAYLLLGTGVLGGFTTFSAFALDASSLAGSSRASGAVYVAASVVLGLLAFQTGRWLVSSGGAGSP